MTSNLFNPSNSNADQAAEVFEFTRLDGSAVKIRTAVRAGQPWFVLRDVCEVLRLTNPAERLSILHSDDKCKLDLCLATTKHGKPHRRGSAPSCISESGLYRIIMRSDKPDARPFQDWVTKTVLPTIRKEGVYIRGEEKVATATNLNELESLQEQMLALMARKETILTAKLQEAEERLKVAEPKADQFGILFDTDGLVRLSEVYRALKQKDPQLNTNKMTPKLIELEFLFRQTGSNVLRVRVKSSKYFVERLSDVIKSSGQCFSTSKVFCTKEGVELLWSYANAGVFPTRKAAA